MDCLRLVITNPKNLTLFERTIKKIAKGDTKLYNEYILEVINKIQQRHSLTSILELIKHEQLLFNSDAFRNYRLDMEESDNYIINPFEIEEGVMECRKCGSNKVISYTKQMRSADEPATVFGICSRCNHKWRE